MYLWTSKSWKSFGYDGIQTDLSCQRSALSDCSCFTDTTMVYSIGVPWPSHCILSISNHDSGVTTFVSILHMCLKRTMVEYFDVRNRYIVRLLCSFSSESAYASPWVLSCGCECIYTHCIAVTFLCPSVCQTPWFQLLISQGSVATHLRCGGMFSDSIITIFLLILALK